MKRILTLTSWLLTSWSAVVVAQYPSRFTAEEALREGGTLWEWLLLFLILYVAGLISLFIACLIKFRRHRPPTKYFAICLRMAKDHAKLFSAYAFGHFIIGIPVILIPSGIIVAIVNGLFFNFQSERLLIVWVVSVIALILLGSLSFALRESLRDLEGEEYFQAVAKVKRKLPTT